ncbi:MAG: hypothetical protein SCK28_05560 [Bacillota bacterium]|nr:hypothetical protein [Bacillota bacterium]
MICFRCNQHIPEEEEYVFHGQSLCEDCYVGAIQPPRSCDVAAVHAAKAHRLATGQTGTEGLTELQIEIYNYVKIQGKVTKKELVEKFNIHDWELDKQFAVLRHCELLKGRKEGERVFLVPFEY